MAVFDESAVAGDDGHDVVVGRYDHDREIGCGDVVQPIRPAYALGPCLSGPVVADDVEPSAGNAFRDRPTHCTKTDHADAPDRLARHAASPPGSRGYTRRAFASNSLSRSAAGRPTASTYRFVSSQWNPVSGSMPRTAPIISDANSTLSMPLPRTTRSPTRRSSTHDPN